MLKATLREIFNNPKLWQAVIFAICQVAGLAAYAGLNQFKAYAPPHGGQLVGLTFFEFVIFCTFYLIISRNRTTLLTERLALLLTLICWLIGLLNFPSVVSALTGLTVLVLALMSLIPALLSNEWGLLTAGFLLATNTVNFFMVNHQYLPVSFTNTLLLPTLIYIFFLASLFETTFVIGVEFASALAILIVAIMTRLNPLVILLDLGLLVFWLHCLLRLSLKKSQIAVLAGLLAGLMLFLNG